MHNLVFFMWMLLYPLTWDISDYIQKRLILKSKEPVPFDWLSGIIFLTIYMFIGYLLYQKS